MKKKTDQTEIKHGNEAERIRGIFRNSLQDVAGLGIGKQSHAGLSVQADGL